LHAVAIIHARLGSEIIEAHEAARAEWPSRDEHGAQSAAKRAH